MKADGLTLFSFATAIVTCGAPLGVAAWFTTGDAGVVVWATSGFVLAALAATLLIASARRRSRTRRESGDWIPNPFGSLIAELTAEIDEVRNRADESDRRLAASEARLHAARARARRLEGSLDGIAEPVVVTDARDETLFVNEAARDLFAIEQDALQASNRLPTSLRELVFETRTRSAAADRRVRVFELSVDDESRAFRASSVPVVENGRVLAVGTVLHDVNDERSVRTRHAEFVSSATHELKTPLSGIRAFAEMLVDGETEDAAEVRELSEFILVQVDRLTGMIESMLNLARIESGVIEVDREDCELNDVVRDAIRVVVPMADEKSIVIAEELSDLYLPVCPDRRLLGQAFVNLLSNAVKYTPEGGSVSVTSRMTEDRAVVEFRDTGMGIPPESLPKLFERFYRVPQNNGAAAGTGLGLALVHDILTELHGGEIAVDSEVGEGTCFTVTLPLGHRIKSSRRLVETTGARN